MVSAPFTPARIRTALDARLLASCGIIAFAMGIAYVEGIVSHPSTAKRKTSLRFLVDTGAFFTVVPKDVLRKLGVKSSRVERVRFADGRTTKWKVGEAKLAVNGRSTTTWVLFGKPNTQPLLGAYSLEGLGLIVDPRTKRLVPMPVVIVAATDCTSPPSYAL